MTLSQVRREQDRDAVLLAQRIDPVTVQTKMSPARNSILRRVPASGYRRATEIQGHIVCVPDNLDHAGTQQVVAGLNHFTQRGCFSVCCHHRKSLL